MTRPDVVCTPSRPIVLFGSLMVSSYLTMSPGLKSSCARASSLANLAASCSMMGFISASFAASGGTFSVISVNRSIVPTFMLPSASL